MRPFHPQRVTAAELQGCQRSHLLGPLRLLVSETISGRAVLGEASRCQFLVSEKK
jgi:hypothetical protein